MKVAIIQDWFTVNGGAEKVIVQLHQMFPEADFFSLVDILSEKDREIILKGKSVSTSFIQKLPGYKKYFRNYLALFPTAISHFDFSNYDLIISSSYAVAKGIKTSAKQTHICYCHTPIRYAWDLNQEYLSQFSGIKKVIVKYTLQYIAKWDLKTANNPDIYIANSEFVAKRIYRLYKQKATVIHPPVSTNKFTYSSDKKEYYFVSSRLVAYKKIDLIVKAFNQLPHLKLIVGGDGPELELLKANADKNISFIGHVSEKVLIRHMQSAKAFILAAVEDFGITSLEAQSCGTPVIALRNGGYLETVIENKTGLFFKNQDLHNLVDAVKEFEKNPIYIDKKTRDSHVINFTENNFKTHLKKIIAQYA